MKIHLIDIILKCDWKNCKIENLLLKFDPTLQKSFEMLGRWKEEGGRGISGEGQLLLKVLPTAGTK